MNRNQRRQAHDLKRSGGVLGRVASGNHLAAQNDEPEPFEDAKRLAAMFDGPLEGEERDDTTPPRSYPDGLPYCLERAINQRRGHL